MLLLTEDQATLQAAAREVLDQEAPLARYRTLRDAGARRDEALWAQLVELGWPAMVFEEAQGGLGWGLPEAAVVLECAGRNLALTPLISVLQTAALDPEARGVGGGVVALAWQEARDLDVASACTVSGGRITGRKRAVLDAEAAEAFVVSAREEGELGLFLVASDAVSRAPLDRLDHRDAADIRLDGAPCQRIEGGERALVEALHLGAVGLSAELLGLSRRALEMTLAYSLERVQFDRPIGSFQALQHRMVDMYIAVEQLQTAVLVAAREPTRAHVALAKATANETAMSVCREAVQIHGGIGVTDEHDVGFLLKRAMVASQTLGTTRYWRDQWAISQGY